MILNFFLQSWCCVHHPLKHFFSKIISCNDFFYSRSTNGWWVAGAAHFKNVKHYVVVEFHIRVGESYYCSSCGAYSCCFIKSLNVFFFCYVLSSLSSFLLGSRNRVHSEDHYSHELCFPIFALPMFPHHQLSLVLL